VRILTVPSWAGRSGADLTALPPAHSLYRLSRRWSLEAAIPSPGRAAVPTPHRPRSEERLVLAASWLLWVFQWYDFFLYAVLAPVLASLFFPAGNGTAAVLSAFVVYAVGLLVQPFGGLVFRRIGDGVGAKHRPWLTTVAMGSATALIGLLPTYPTVGMVAPGLLIALRLVQGLALGGEHQGVALYAATQAGERGRGYATGWIRTTPSLGLLLALLVVALIRAPMDAGSFARWGWRLPFLLSVVLLGFCVLVQRRLDTSAVLERMNAPAPRSSLRETLFEPPNRKYVLLALLGATAGQGVVWYTGQLYVLFFLTLTLKLAVPAAGVLLGLALLVGAPFVILFGALSDRIGRLRIILAGCLLAAVTSIPLFKALTQALHPALEHYQAATPISVSASDCGFHVFVTPRTRFSDCDRVRDFLTRAGLSFSSAPSEGAVITRIGGFEIRGWDEARLTDALKQTGYPFTLDTSRASYATAGLILVVMALYAAMVSGPLTALLVELFPPSTRQASMTFADQVGNGWFGGLLPLGAMALAAASGDIYQGLWYPIGVSVMTVLVGVLFLMDRPREDGP
jgi:MFS family permease